MSDQAEHAELVACRVAQVGRIEVVGIRGPETGFALIAAAIGHARGIS